jgi:hypothetical protein
MSGRDTPAATIRAKYETRRLHFEEERQRLVRRANLISTARLLAFVAAGLGLVAGLWGWRLSSPLWTGLGVVACAGFVALVVWHDHVLGARDRAALLVSINVDALHRLAREWGALPAIPVPASAAQDPVARDLDLLVADHGRASVLQLLGTARTSHGRGTLVAWLLGAAPPAEVTDRQDAVAGLAPCLDLRQELELRGRELGDDPPDPELFLAWAEGAPVVLGKWWLVWVPRALAVVAVSLAVLLALGLVPAGWLVMAGAVNLAFAAVAGRKIRETFGRIAGRGQTLRRYARLFQLLSRMLRAGSRTSRSSILPGRASSPPGPEVLQGATIERIAESLTAEGRDVSRQMRRLERLAGLAEARHTPLFHVPLMALTLWDFHVLYGLERWQQRVGPRVRGWFAALGEVEALCALAGLSHDHPDWAFPRIDEQADALRAEGLGHPLLHPDACVVNDVVIGPPGRFMLVTGSNMSGKSTLLRSVGVNVALAQAGGPTFARSLVLPPLVLGTSFRVQDSLEAGVSFFMAELRRLKEVVDLARRVRTSHRHRLLYLLDEILQGTNVYERQIAVRRVIVHLLREGALGAVSTHDLTLAEAETLAEACVCCHFTESYQAGGDGGPRMVFDYRLRPGVATSVNALKLLALVGLDDGS